MTRTRICQYLRLLDLPQEIVDFVGDPANEERTQNITEAALRTILALTPPCEQRRAFEAMVAK